MANRRKNTATLRAHVLAALGEDANVSAAARRAGVDRATLYKWRRKCPTFARAWDEAVEQGLDALEDEAIRRSLHGTRRAVFYKGEPRGEITLPSDNLLMFMLRHRRPWRYGQAADSVRRETKAEPPVVVELVHFGDKPSFEARKAELEADRAAGVPGVPPGIAALSDRLAAGTCLSTEAPPEPP